tara:strand:- start:985 stop:1236 length:252 start_codon:yes stop_codon:yes gene_type:complete
LNANSQIHISIALLIKAGILIAIVTGSWYQAQMKFAEQQRRIEDLENKLTVLTASVEGMETQHIQDLEETNRSLMQRLGLRKP